MRAHIERNRETSRLFALSLGFIIFLLGSYKLLSSTNSSSTDKRWGNKPSFYTSYYNSLQPKRLEPILKKNEHLIESFAWITFDINSIQFIQKTEVTDPSKLKRFTVNTLAVTPSIFNGTSRSELTVEYHHSGLSLGEELYTARGC